MKLKQIIQILCVLAGIAIVAYSSNALTPNLDVNYPTGLNAYFTSDAGITITWNGISDINLKQYLIYKNTSPIDEGHEEFLYTQTDVGRLIDDKVNENVTYYYRVRIEYKDGNYSRLSNEISQKAGKVTKALVDQNYPTNLNAYLTSDFGIALYWTGIPDVNLRQYIIYRSTGPIDEGHEELRFSQTPFTDFGDGQVAENTTYFYRVRAEFTDGTYSQLSNEVSRKTGRLTQAYLDSNTLDTFAGSTDSLNLTIRAPADNKTHDVKVKTSSFKDGLFVSTDTEDLTLNSGEQIDLAINVTSLDSLEDGSFRAEVRVTEDGIVKKLGFTVRIGGSTNIVFEGGDQRFCNSSYIVTIPITIKNNSAREFRDEQALNVVASSDQFAPSLSPNDFNLYRGQTANATIRLTNDPNAHLNGNFYVTLTATQPDQNWKSVDRINFSLRDCNSTDYRDFSIGLVNSITITTWTKGKAYDVNFSLGSAGTEISQDIDINVETSPYVPASYVTRLVIPGNGSVKGTVTFYPQINTIPGDFNFKIVASNGNKTKELKVEKKIKIAALNQFTLSPTQNTISIIEDYPSDVEFSIQNGDSAQTFNLSASGSDGISVTNIPTVTVQPRSSQTFTVRVYAKPGVTGNKQLTLTARTSGLDSQSKTINVNVTPNTSQTRDAIHILAFPSLIQTDVNQTQEVVFTLENATEIEMTNVSISVSGLPEGASMNSLSDISLRPHYPQNVTGVIKTSANTPRGRYEVQFTAQQGRYITRVKGFMEVGTIHNDSLLGDVSTGLASLGQNWQVGLFVVLAIIGGLFILSKIGQAVSSPKQGWMK